MTTSLRSFADNNPADGADIELVAERLGAIRSRVERVSSGREVTIVAVTKTYGYRAVSAALAAGADAVGENYASELVEKAHFDVEAPWHFIGSLQSRHIAGVASVATVISGVAREKEIDRLAAVNFDGLIDIQVDVTGFAQRHGAAVGEVENLVTRAHHAGLSVRGLMTVADPAEPHRAFRVTRALADDLGLSGCSMGMSGDFELAVEYGATEVRIGSALFGHRT
jgi:uncharacterized pyridoxal phosphate-containing UPF0001 family protein